MIKIRPSKTSPKGKMLFSGKAFGRVRNGAMEEEVLFSLGTVFRIESSTDHELVLSEIDSEE